MGCKKFKIMWRAHQFRPFLLLNTFLQWQCSKSVSQSGYTEELLLSIVELFRCFLLLFFHKYIVIRKIYFQAFFWYSFFTHSMKCGVFFSWSIIFKIHILFHNSTDYISWILRTAPRLRAVHLGKSLKTGETNLRTLLFHLCCYHSWAQLTNNVASANR